MAFATVPLVASSDSWTASQHNTYIRDNFAAVWVGTTAGDTEYYNSATGKTRVPIGTAYKVNYSTGSAPAWGTLATITQNSAIVASQATGDIPYANSASTTARLAIGGANSFLKSDGSTPSYGGVCYKRQGGSSTTWATAGTSNYTPTVEKIQSGVVTATVTSGTGTASVTFPELYYYAPHIVMTPKLLGASARISAPTIYSVSTTGFTLEVYYIDGAYNGTIEIHWTARGY